ncbi:NADH dehydrogenase [ubiquinone] complex I, assembly factor 7 [Clonorchis sinensis]|uniref:Protein arginine methyltransferase NDUFAF7 n=1 Tax=Clonorchis sinensis TaxID=79923 RepID=A0A8T1MJP2_CLOSI|nr:NADH dehydrogenase [ubiquinone] complex I, assembly factor 7 [Clonorchis sinensis]
MYSWLRNASRFVIPPRRTYAASALQQHLFERISTFGPISVAEFMKESLTNPLHGYYMKSDVFGKFGDFITSPEICQIFGELIGVWFVNEWQELQRPQSFSFIELGPGRGTLVCDILRVFSRFPSVYNALTLHLVEVSPAMRSLQQNSIEKTVEKLGLSAPSTMWHTDFRDVPHGQPAFVLAHEFLDALPVHQFQKNPNGQWHEVLVGLSEEGSGESKLCFVQAPNRTPAQVAYLPLVATLLEGREFCELSPRALLLTDQICQRIAQDGGAALLVDYGHLGDKKNTLRGFRKHQVCDPLLDPGGIDLTCDVDFSFLRKRAQDSGCAVEVFGPESQAYFLINMGLLTRLKALASQCNSVAHREELISGCEMLITGEQMGERFKFLAIVQKSCTNAGRQIPGFFALPGTPYAE